MKWLFKKEIIGFAVFFTAVTLIFDAIYRRPFNFELISNRLGMGLVVWLVYGFIQRGQKKKGD